ncbi:glycosyltransferase, partial [Streptomyces sp. Ru72]
MNARTTTTTTAGSHTLLVIAKEPVPGRVKTRLTPPYTPQEAAALAEAALTDTLNTMLQVPARRRVLVLDGARGPWLPPGFEVLPQAPGGLDERIAAAF